MENVDQIHLKNKILPIFLNNENFLGKLMSTIKAMYFEKEISFDPHNYIVIQYSEGEDLEVLKLVSNEKYNPEVHNKEYLNCLYEIERYLNKNYISLIINENHYNKNNPERLLLIDLFPKVHIGDDYTSLKIRDKKTNMDGLLIHNRGKTQIIAIVMDIDNIEEAKVIFEFLSKTMNSPQCDLVFLGEMNEFTLPKRSLREEINFITTEQELRKYGDSKEFRVIIINDDGKVIANQQMYYSYLSSDIALCDELESLTKNYLSSPFSNLISNIIPKSMMMSKNADENRLPRFRVYSFDDENKAYILYSF